MIKYFGITLSIRIHFLAKYLIRVKQARNGKLVNKINDGLINLRNAIVRKEWKKIVDIARKILHFNKNPKRYGNYNINS